MKNKYLLIKLIILCSFSYNLQGQVEAISISQPCAYPDFGSVVITLDESFYEPYWIYPFTVDWINEDDLSSGSFQIVSNSFQIDSLTLGDYEIIIEFTEECDLEINFEIKVDPNQVDVYLVSFGNSTICTPFGESADGFIDIGITDGTLSGYSIEWFKDSTFISSSEDIYDLEIGDYKVIVTGNSGCVDSLEVSLCCCVDIGDIFLPYVTSSSSCNSSLSLNADVTPATSVADADGSIITLINSSETFTTTWIYLQDTISYAQSIFNLAPGSYTLFLDNGCSQREETYIVGDQSHCAVYNLSVSIQEHNSCEDSPSGNIYLNANGGTPPYSYLWSTGSTQANLEGILPGDYYVTITDINYCDTSLYIPLTEVQENFPMDISSWIHPDCNFSGIGHITLNSTNKYTYHWSDGFVGNYNTGLIAGDYCVTVYDQINCLGDSCFTVPNEDYQIITNEIITLPFCTGFPNGSIDLNLAPGSYTILWDDGSQTSILDHLTFGTYCVDVTDAGGCKERDCFSLYNGNEFSIVINDFVSGTECYQPGVCYGLVDISIEGGNGSYQYQWFDENNNIISTSQDVSGLCEGTYTVKVRSQSCTQYQTFEICCCTEEEIVGQDQAGEDIYETVPGNCYVNGYSELFINSSGIFPTAPNFDNGSVNLEIEGGTGNYFIKWWTWPNIIGETQLDNLTPGNYSATIKDGCQERNVSIDLLNPINNCNDSLELQISNITCIGSNLPGSISVIAINGGTSVDYEWSNGQTTANSHNGSTIYSSIPGEYIVTITDDNDCQIVESIFLEEGDNDISIQIFPQNVKPCRPGYQDGSVEVTVIGNTSGYTTLWNTGETTDIITVDHDGLYSVTVTDGCQVLSAEIFLLCESQGGCGTTVGYHGSFDGCFDECNAWIFEGSCSKFTVNPGGGIGCDEAYIYWSDGEVTVIQDGNIISGRSEWIFPGPGLYGYTIWDNGEVFTHYENIGESYQEHSFYNITSIDYTISDYGYAYYGCLTCYSCNLPVVIDYGIVDCENQSHHTFLYEPDDENNPCTGGGTITIECNGTQTITVPATNIVTILEGDYNYAHGSCSDESIDCLFGAGVILELPSDYPVIVSYCDNYTNNDTIVLDSFPPGCVGNNFEFGEYLGDCIWEARCLETGEIFEIESIPETCLYFDDRDSLCYLIPYCEENCEIVDDIFIFLNEPIDCSLPFNECPECVEDQLRLVDSTESDPDKSQSSNEDLLITIYPIPSQSIISVKINNIDSDFNFAIYDVNGQFTGLSPLNISENTEANSMILQYNLTDIPAGVYIFTTFSSSGIESRKFIKI